jgi:hypothetical protein
LPSPAAGWATLTWVDARPLATYELQVRTAGDAVRLRIPATRFGGQNPKLAELAVRG